MDVWEDDKYYMQQFSTSQGKNYSSQMEHRHDFSYCMTWLGLIGHYGNYKRIIITHHNQWKNIWVRWWQVQIYFPLMHKYKQLQIKLLQVHRHTLIMGKCKELLNIWQILYSYTLIIDKYKQIWMIWRWLHNITLDRINLHI